jgi:hypothetical protein
MTKMMDAFMDDSVMVVGEEKVNNDIVMYFLLESNNVVFLKSNVFVK